VKLLLRRVLRVGTILFLVVFLGLTVVPLSNRPLEVVQVSQPLRSDFICVFGSTSVGQTFVSRVDNLDGVEIYFGPILSENASVILHLQVGGRDVRTVSVNASDLVYHQYNRFNFTTILDSANKNYSFVLQSPDSTFRDPVCVSYIDDSLVSSPTVYADGYALMDGARLSGDLTFRITSEITLAEAFNDLYGRASKDSSFFAVYFVVLAIVAGVLLRVNASIKGKRLLNKRGSRTDDRK